jgi:hypothetical protein
MGDLFAPLWGAIDGCHGEAIELLCAAKYSEYTLL